MEEGQRDVRVKGGKKELVCVKHTRTNFPPRI